MPLEEKTVQTSKGFDLSRISSFRTEIYGFSALWICLYHAYMCKYKWPFFLAFLRAGNIGVEIFLFMSGISQHYSYNRNRHLADFYRKRIIRLWVPVLSVGTVFSLYYFWFLKQYNWKALVQAMDRKLFIPSYWYQNEPQIWFAAMILAAYLLFPLFYHFIYCKTDGIIARTCILLAAIILIIIQFLNSGSRPLQAGARTGRRTFTYSFLAVQVPAPISTAPITNPVMIDMTDHLEQELTL